MSLKNVEMMEVKEDTATQASILDFGFEAEFTTETEYTTISGKEYRDMSNAAGYSILDFDIGEVIQGYPEITLFDNNEKDENGEFKRKSQSVRLRLIDDDEYVDLYANIPRRDEKGFISNLNKGFNFMRTGFDLCFSFMRFLDEINVITNNGEEINRINKINIEAVCTAIDRNNFVKVRIVKSNDENYPSWIILDMKNL